MYRKLAGSEGADLGYHVEGTITGQEVKEIHREVTAALERHGKVRLLMEVGALKLPEPMAVLRDLRLTPEYLRDVERFALVGDARWQEWAARATNFLARGEARHFASGEMDRAWEWLREGPPKL
jgi:hypothetical protein